MTEQEIYSALTAIFREVFANAVLTVNPRTDATQIAGWDSFAQINIIVAAEARFGVRFRSNEAQSMKTVADLVRLIRLKRTSGATG
jgi:acyl carrier protein